MARLPGYADFPEIARRSSWDAEAIDLAADAVLWRQPEPHCMAGIAALLAGFLVGEHAVATDIEPFHAQAPSEEILDTSQVEEAGWASIRLPTLGRKVAHELLLQTLDGELLDKSGPYGIVESIHMSLVVDGHDNRRSLAASLTPRRSWITACSVPTS